MESRNTGSGMESDVIDYLEDVFTEELTLGTTSPSLQIPRHFTNGTEDVYWTINGWVNSLRLKMPKTPWSKLPMLDARSTECVF